MSKCVNCAESAPYRLSDPGALPLDFCASHVPTHLADRLASGDLTVEVVAEVKRSAKSDVSADSELPVSKK